MLRLLTAGESHGSMLTLIVEGLPANIEISEEKINAAMARRQKGYGRGGRMLIEKDSVEVVAGVRFGKTTGSPVSMIIKNKDWENWLDDMAVFGKETSGRALRRPRPGHADLTGLWKYDLAEARPVLERASARETATRVAAGELVNALLQSMFIEVGSHVRAIGDVFLPEEITLSVAQMCAIAEQSDVSCVCAQTAAKMRVAIDMAKTTGDTLGGIVEVAVDNVIPGLGSHVHWDRRLDGLLAQAVMSIPAFKAVEIGAGIKAATMLGGMVHDEIFPQPGGVCRGSNRAGGLEGGMTNGEQLVVRGYMKPIPTLMQPLSSIDIKTGLQETAAAERSDTCAVPAAAVVAEAMVKWILAQAVLEKFAADNLRDLMLSVNSYRQRIKEGGYGPCKW